MKPVLQSLPDRCSALLVLCGLCLLPAASPAEKPAAAESAPQPAETSEQGPAKIKARILLSNGDRLSGEPHGLDASDNLEFTSDSLLQKASFPLAKVSALELDTWKPRKRPDTVARVQVQPTFGETVGDVLLGRLQELTPESIVLDTWFGGTVSLKRSMVKSLQIISTGPGSYFGPNNIKEWSTAGSKDAWHFSGGSLVSRSNGSVGRDVGLTEKSHISFDAAWKNTMRFRVQLYSSDVSDASPDAYYDVNFNRTYAYLRTRGKVANGGAIARGGRWQQIQTPRDATRAHFDIFIDRKTGTITIYLNGKHACILQSQSPDPSNLGTGLTFIAEERYPVEISNINVSPWNGTSFPNQKAAAPSPDPDAKKDKDKKDDAAGQPPHRIILKNGDTVPGTVGKVQDDRMIVETKYTPIRIPLNRIKSLSLGADGDQPRKYAGDVRAWFHEGGHVTIKLTAFKEGKISGYSQAYGDVTFDLRAFSRIDFHIYAQPTHP